MSYKTFLVSFLSFILILFSIYVYLRYFTISEDELRIESIDKSKVIVTTTVGQFVGSKVFYENKEISVFLGIPYALPPINSLRFKKAVPIKESKETIEANRWPNPCLQKDNHLRLNSYNFSEDCLYLNVWTRLANGSEAKPVVFHIHTGAFLFGSASESTYNGLVLSALADVVVVTFNYRLNLYGFLYTGTEQVFTNAGMFDQILALEWVVDHISHFGGDPNRITLLGQSTGALSVGHHLMSPITSGLFESAIMLSGSPLQHLWLSEPEEAKRFWINYSKEVNCIKRENQITSRVLKCLTQLERNRLPEMTDSKRYSADPFVVSAPVVFDNHFKPKKPIESLINRNVSLLFGYTDDEGSWLLALHDNHRFGPKVEQNLTFIAAKHELRQLLAKIKPNSEEKQINVEDIVSHYFDKIPENQRNDSNLLSRTIGTALGDHYISCQSHHFSDYLNKISNNSKIYQYYWTYKGYSKSSSFWKTFEEVWCGKWMGACHSFELYAIFGVPFQQTIAFNDIDRLISKKFIKIVSDFVHNKKLTSKEWLAFNFNGNKLVKPYYRIDFDLDSDHRIGFNLKTYECDSLWKESIVV